MPTPSTLTHRALRGASAGSRLGVSLVAVNALLQSTGVLEWHGISTLEVALRLFAGATLSGVIAGLLRPFRRTASATFGVTFLALLPLSVTVAGLGTGVGLLAGLPLAAMGAAGYAAYASRPLPCQPTKWTRQRRSP